MQFERSVLDGFAIACLFVAGIGGVVLAGFHFGWQFIATAVAAVVIGWFAARGGERLATRGRTWDVFLFLAAAIGLAGLGSAHDWHWLATTAAVVGALWIVAR